MDTRKKHISVVTPCYNEEGNVRALYGAVKQVFAGLADRYTYEHIFIDNASKDGTVAILKEIAARIATSKSSSTPAISATSVRRTTPCFRRAAMRCSRSWPTYRIRRR